MIPIRLAEEAVWELSQQVRQLQEYRADVRSTWDDSAARQINGRHLDPMAEDIEQLLAAVRRLHDLLTDAQESLVESHQSGLTATRAGAAARGALELAERELHEGQRCQMLSAALLAILRHGLLPQIRDALKCADECGG